MKIKNALLSSLIVVMMVGSIPGHTEESDQLIDRISTVVGTTDEWWQGHGSENAEPGFSGDGGPARNAQLAEPKTLAIDEAGNLYINDSLNARIRKVDLNGTITTFAGGGDASAELAAIAARTYSSTGVATEMVLHSPTGMAFGPDGALYFAQAPLNAAGIRKISPDGTLSSLTLQPALERVGSFMRYLQLSGPRGIAFDDFGNLFVADTSNDRIRKISSDGTMVTVVGTGRGGNGADWGGEPNFSGDGGPASAAYLYSPHDIAFDDEGNLYISDTLNFRLRKVTAEDDGSVLPTSIISTIAGNGQVGMDGDGGSALQAKLNPKYIAFGKDGSLYISCYSSNRIRKVSPDGIISTVTGQGTSAYVGWGYSGDGGPASAAHIAMPEDIVFDADGSLYFADNYVLVRKIDFGVVAPSQAQAPDSGPGDPDTTTTTEAGTGIGTGTETGTGDDTPPGTGSTAGSSCSLNTNEPEGNLTFVLLGMTFLFALFWRKRSRT